MTTRHPWESELGVGEKDSPASQRHLIDAEHSKPEENSESLGWEEDVSKTEVIHQRRLGTRNLGPWMGMSMKDLVVKSRIHTS